MSSQNKNGPAQGATANPQGYEATKIIPRSPASAGGERSENDDEEFAEADTHAKHARLLPLIPARTSPDQTSTRKTRQRRRPQHLPPRPPMPRRHQPQSMNRRKPTQGDDHEEAEAQIYKSASRAKTSQE